VLTDIFIVGSKLNYICLYNITIKEIVFLFQDKLLTKLEENEPELASSQEDEVRNESKVIARIRTHIFLKRYLQVISCLIDYSETTK